MAKGADTLGRKSPGSGFGAAVLVVLTCFLVFVIYKNATAEPIMPDAGAPGPEQTDALTPTPSMPVVTEEVVSPEPEETGEPEPTPEPLPEFSPAPVEGTEPSKLIIETAVEVNGKIAEDYVSEEMIDFGYGADYTDLEGIITFRGNNFRTAPPTALPTCRSGVSADIGPRPPPPFRPPTARSGQGTAGPDSP